MLTVNHLTKTLTAAGYGHCNDGHQVTATIGDWSLTALLCDKVGRTGLANTHCTGLTLHVRGQDPHAFGTEYMRFTRAKQAIEFAAANRKLAVNSFTRDTVLWLEIVAGPDRLVLPCYAGIRYSAGEQYASADAVALARNVAAGGLIHPLLDCLMDEAPAHICVVAARIAARLR